MLRDEIADPAALTRTEQAALEARRRPATGVRRWWRRRPVRRGLVLTHRWTSLVLGLLLVIETTAGAVVLFQGEWFRASHGALYHHTAPSGGSAAVTPEQAVAIVHRAHPDYRIGFVSSDHGILAVGDTSYRYVYGVDPGSGRITGYADTDGGVMGFLVNLHDCGLTCAGYPGYQSWLAHAVPTGGITFLTGITWGGMALGVLGLLMILLAVTGVVVWWPGITRMARGFRVRTGKGRFARDYDLHNLIGIIALPTIFLWGVTGAAFEFPVVENAWLAVTGGEKPDPNTYAFTPAESPKNAPDIGLDAAIRVARTHAAGSLGYAEIIPGDAAYYSVSIHSSGYAPHGHRLLYSGDKYVYVNAHDATDVKIVDGTHEPVANSFYDRYVEAAHFGWMVNGWWRIAWCVFGLTPLALMITGISTWLFRRKTRKRRRTAGRATPAVA